MKRTLLVEVDVEDPGTLPELALEVQDILSDSGLSIISVKPWNSQTDGLTPPTTPSAINPR